MKALVTALLILLPVTAEAAVRIVVPARDIARGDVITESDLTFRTIEGEALMSGVATTIAGVSGMQARRVLRAGEAFRDNDVRRPVIVAKGQTVTMQFSVPGVELTAMGRAMSEGGIGDTVTIQNPVSYRMIAGTIVAPGTVRATGPINAPINKIARR